MKDDNKLNGTDVLGNVYSDDEYYRQFRKAQTKLVKAVDYHQLGQRYQLSIIVPYRDNPYQNRKHQLDRFVPYMTYFLSQLGANYNGSMSFMQSICTRGRLSVARFM